MKLNCNEEADNLIVIELNGRMDSDGIALVDGSLDGSIKNKNAILDLSDVEYMSSLGVRKLLQLAKAAKKSGKKIVIANPQDFVLGVLKMANIDMLINITASLDDARTVIGKGA